MENKVHTKVIRARGACIHTHTHKPDERRRMLHVKTKLRKVKAADAAAAEKQRTLMIYKA